MCGCSPGLTEAGLEWNKENRKGKREMMAIGKLRNTAPVGQVTCSDGTEKKVLQLMNTQVW